MGIGCSGALQAQSRHNREIEEQLEEEWELNHKQIRLLLLGTGESGKSAILKQIQILYKGGFNDAQIAAYKPTVYSNTINSMAVLIAGLKILKISLENAELEVECNKITHWLKAGDEAKPFSREIVESLKSLWADKGILECYGQRHRLQLLDSAKYFLDDLDRISRPEYRPTDQDILYARAYTIGITQVHFEVFGNYFLVFDVGGQRSERRKWMHIFDDVDALIFMVASSEYDKLLREDEHTNRMQDSVSLFGNICNSEWFETTGIVLFLNKRDIFAEKIVTVPITVAFPHYDGPQNYEASMEYIIAQYRSQDNRGSIRLKVHETCAIKNKQIQPIIRDTLESIIAKNLENIERHSSTSSA